MARPIYRPIDPSLYQLPTAEDLAEDAVLQLLAAIPEGLVVRKADAIVLFDVHRDRWAAWQRARMMPRGVRGPMEGGLAARCWRPPHESTAATSPPLSGPGNAMEAKPEPREGPGSRRASAARRQCYYEVETLIRARVAMRRQEEPYPDSHEAGVWRLPVASHSGSNVALIDEIDLPVVKGRRWTFFRLGQDHVWGVMLSSSGNAAAECRGGGAGYVPQLLHRMLLGVQDRPDLFVLHRNHDPLDCRRSNLFVRTIQEKVHANTKRGLRSGKVYSSKYKGVSWIESRGKWRAYIGQDGRSRSLGHFDDEEDAACAYDAAARELFTSCAALNFPGPGEASALKLAA